MSPKSAHPLTSRHRSSTAASLAGESASLSGAVHGKVYREPLDTSRKTIADIRSGRLGSRITSNDRPASERMLQKMIASTLTKLTTARTTRAPRREQSDADRVFLKTTRKGAATIFNISARALRLYNSGHLIISLRNQILQNRLDLYVALGDTYFSGENQ